MEDRLYIELREVVISNTFSTERTSNMIGMYHLVTVNNKNV